MIRGLTDLYLGFSVSVIAETRHSMLHVAGNDRGHMHARDGAALKHYAVWEDRANSELPLTGDKLPQL